MKFCFTTIKVKDMETSIKFYEEIVGLKITTRFSPRPGMEIVFLSDGEHGKIELIEFKDSKDGSKGTAVSIGFAVDDIQDTIEFLQSKNISIIHELVITPTGEKFIYVCDPDGVEVEFIEGFHF